jgi:peptidyl-prolyl cis-trans isomerase SurA
MMRIKNLFLGVVSCLISITSVAQEANKAQLLDKIIAKVDNHYILKSEIEQQFQQYQSSGQANTPDRCQILEGLVINKLMLAKAEIDSVIVDDKRIEMELNSRMDQMEQQYGTAKNIVEAFGKPIATMKEELRANLKEQMTGRKMQDKITDDVKITPKEVAAFFATIPTDSLPYLPSEVEVGHIVRLAQPNKDQKNELISRLLDYRRRIEKGESFEELAKLYSEDLGSGKRGGDLGFSKRGQMVAPFEAAALKLKPNQMSEVVESEFGFHMIQLLDVRGQEYHARHILLRPDYQKLDLRVPTKYLDSIRILIQRDTVKFDAAARENSQDKGTQDAGGLIMDMGSRSYRIPFDGTMEPGLYFSIDSMKVGTISTPIPFRTEDGRSAVRILYFKAKHPPHFANLKADYQKISNIALTRKKNDAIEKWFLKAKEDVFIYIDDEFKRCNTLGTVGGSSGGSSQ